MPSIPAMPTPEGLSGQPIPAGWFADMWRVVEALRRAEQLRGLGTGDGRGRRERTAAIVHMTSATVGDVYTTSEDARETGATIKALDGVTLTEGAWYLAQWMDIDGGSYWTTAGMGPETIIDIIEDNIEDIITVDTSCVSGLFEVRYDATAKKLQYRERGFKLKFANRQISAEPCDWATTGDPPEDVWTDIFTAGCGT